MIVLETIAVAFAMFSAIPVPQPVWGPRNMRYALCALPLIGVVIGLAQALWLIAANWLCMPEMLRGAGLCLIPVLLTGGIHLDGYADTSDALASCAPPEKKQEILKDPRCGAFAVIRLGVWFVASFALCTAVPGSCLFWNELCAQPGVVRLGGGHLPAGKKHRPCPHLRHLGGPGGSAPGAAGSGNSAGDLHVCGGADRRCSHVSGSVSGAAVLPPHE